MNNIIKLDAPALGTNTVLIEAIETPLGWIGFGLTSKGLIASVFMYKTKEAATTSLKAQKLLKEFDFLSPGQMESKFQTLLDGWKTYFLKLFSPEMCEVSTITVPLDDTAWTEFHKRVYRFLMSVNAGETVTYGDIAKAVGSPKAFRAVGNAMKKNPVPPVVPCHRVLGSGGQLCGFSAEGGTELKKLLLNMERESTIKHCTS